MFDNIDRNGFFKRRLNIYNFWMDSKCVLTDEMLKRQSI